MIIEGSERYRDTGWRIVTSVTPASTLHALYKPSEGTVAFGVEGVLDESFVQDMIAFLEETAKDSPENGVLLAPHPVGAFNGCAFLGEKERKFLRGWAGADGDITHAFPVFSCELDGDGRLPPFDRFSRAVNVFDPKRQPEPYFSFKMVGGVSKLRVDKWSTEKYSTLKSFVRVLGNEEHSRLEVRNRRGELLSFASPNDWSNALEKLHTHLVRA